MSRIRTKPWVGAVIGVIALPASGHRAAAQTLVLTPHLSVSEQYNDNVFFDDRKVDDFVTSIAPGATLRYDRALLSVGLSGSTSAQFFARQPSNDRIAGTQSGVLDAYYEASPRLSLQLADGVTRVNQTRTDSGQATAPPPDSNDPGQVATLLPRGDALSNFFTMGTGYQLTPRWSTSASYRNSYSNFSNPNGQDVAHGAALSLGYALRANLSTSLSYGYSYFDLNEDPPSTTESHSINVGGGYQYDPYWSASVSAGVFVNRPLRSSGGSISDSIGPLFNVSLTRATERGSISVGAAQTITTSAGVAGVSQTRGVFGQYQMQLTERLSGQVGVHYSHFDTDTTQFQVLQVSAGLSMPLGRYFSAGLTYSYRFRDSSRATASLQKGSVDGNVVSISVTASYPLWSWT